MTKTIFLFLAAIWLMGCSTVKEIPIEKAEQTIDRVTLICNSAHMLSDAGLNVPGVDQCDKIVPQLTREEIGVVLDVLKCAQDNEPTSKDFGLCAVDKGWEPVRDRIQDLME